MATRLFKLASLFFLATLVFGCAKRQPPMSVFTYGYGYCENPRLGTFNVTMRPARNDPGLYELRIDTINTLSNGQYVTIAIANSSLQYELLSPATPVQMGSTLFDGLVSPRQLGLYDTLVIVPYSSAKSTLIDSLSNDNEAICNLPQRDTTDSNNNGASAYTY